MGKSAGSTREFAEYFRFSPAGDHGQGTLFTPWMGECEPDRIYEVNDQQRAHILADHDDWESVSKKDYEAQTKSDEKEQDDDDKE